MIPAGSVLPGRHLPGYGRHYPPKTAPGLYRSLGLLMRPVTAEAAATAGLAR
jgi:hypothetical protein